MGKSSGGSSAPSSTQTTTGVESPYSAQYAQQLLGQASALTSTPYQAYSAGQTAPNGQVAGFSNLQNQSFNEAQNMGTTPQTGVASSMANQAGQQGMGTANTALGYGALGAQAGLSYGQNAQNAQAVGNYMNPYLQASLAPQEQLLAQQQGQQQASNQAQATQAGAFGGSRMGVQNGMQNEANQLAMSNLIGQGYNTAFNTANTNMQQAATLGMQGAAQGQAGVSGAQNASSIGNQSASTLGTLGQQQYAQQTGNINLQNTLGAQQQQYQQNLDTTGYAAYQNQLQLPYQQESFMSSLMNGQPTQGTSTSVYSTPSPVSVAAGLGTAAVGAAGLAKATGIKKGGAIKTKKMAAGGLAALAFSKLG
jgi:hypothetical protein